MGRGREGVRGDASSDKSSIRWSSSVWPSVCREKANGDQKTLGTRRARGAGARRGLAPYDVNTMERAYRGLVARRGSRVISHLDGRRRDAAIGIYGVVSLVSQHARARIALLRRAAVRHMRSARQAVFAGRRGYRSGLGEAFGLTRSCEMLAGERDGVARMQWSRCDRDSCPRASTPAAAAGCAWWRFGR